MPEPTGQMERDTTRADPALSKEELFEAARKGGRGLRRVDALKELIRRGGEDTRRLLAEQLVSRESPVESRLAAATALGRYAQPGEQEALVQALADPDPQVVRRAAESLGRIGDEAAAKRLAAIKAPPLPAAERAVAFARTLASYRLSLGNFRVATLPPSELLQVEKPIQLKPRAASPKTLRKALAHLPQEAPGIAVEAGSGIEFECQGDELLLMLTRTSADALEKGVAGTKDFVVALLLKLSSEGRYALLEYVFAHPEENGFALSGLRPSGALVHTGHARPGQEAMRFELRAVNSRYSPALELNGFARAGEMPLEIASLTVNAGPTEKQKRPARPTPSPVAVPPRLDEGAKR